VTVQDEGFHEIQLNGKQVVFLFMAATVVSVVIFLCGVLVGGVYASIDRRWPTSAGQRTGRNHAAALASTAAAAATAGSDPRALRRRPHRRLSYFNRLETKTPPRENLKSAVDKRVAQSTFG
jgi:hypothetical protein